MGSRNSRWVGSCRRELLDHVIAFNARPTNSLPTFRSLYHHGYDWAGSTIAMIGLLDPIFKQATA
jgi:hypothetical protein